jgi:formate dehydrogenase subunit delta
MANDIARQFGYLTPDEVATAVAGHIAMFWDPRMRRQLAEEVESDPGRLDPAVVHAVTRSG